MIKDMDQLERLEIILAESEAETTVTFRCDDDSTRTFRYDRLICVSGYDELVMVRFEDGGIQIKGQDLEELIWLVAEHRLSYLSKMEKGEPLTRAYVTRIRFIPKKEDGSLQEQDSKPAIDFAFPVSGSDSSPLVSL